MAQGQAAAPPGAAETQDGALLACILDMGELLLTSGAEVMRVEDTLTRLCMVYGFAQADVFTITSSIVLTVRTPEGRALTQTRRIRARDTDLGRVERVNALSRRLCAGPLPPEKFRQAVEEVRNAPAYPDAAPVRHVRRYLSGVLRLFRRHVTRRCDGGRFGHAAVRRAALLPAAAASTVFCRVCWPARWQHWLSC